MKPDLVSIEPLRPQSMAELAETFTVHALPGDRSRWVEAVAPVAERVRFVQTTGFSGCPSDLMRALPNLEIVGVMGVGAQREPQEALITAVAAEIGHDAGEALMALHAGYAA